MSNVPTLQTLVDWANIGVVISLALSFVFGAASIWLGGKLGKLKDAQADTAQRNLELAVATQQERAAKAEKALLELQERAGPRTFALKPFMDALKGKATGTVIIWYDPNVPDAYESIGMNLYIALEGAGWRIESMTPAQPPSGKYKAIPPRVSSGITIEGILEDCEGKDTPYCSLSGAFKVSGLGFQARRYEDLPKDTFRIVIGRRPLLTK
jgi:hypothetical protein